MIILPSLILAMRTLTSKITLASDYWNRRGSRFPTPSVLWLFISCVSIALLLSSCCYQFAGSRDFNDQIYSITHCQPKGWKFSAWKHSKSWVHSKDEEDCRTSHSRPRCASGMKAVLTLHWTCTERSKLRSHKMVIWFLHSNEYYR